MVNGVERDEGDKRKKGEHEEKIADEVVVKRCGELEDGVSRSAENRETFDINFTYSAYNFIF